MIPKRVEPMQTNGIQAGSAHTAAMDLNMLRNTTALAQRLSTTRKTYVYPARDDGIDGSLAPRAAISAANTWTTFSLTGGVEVVDAQYPHYITKHEQRVWVICYMVLWFPSTHYSFRLVRKDLDDEANTQNFQSPRLVVPKSTRMSSDFAYARWGEGSPRSGYAAFISAPHSGTPDADVTFTPQIKIEETQAAGGTAFHDANSSATYYAWLTGLTIMGVGPEGVTG